jgi:hypothetical protein
MNIDQKKNNLNSLIIDNDENDEKMKKKLKKKMKSNEKNVINSEKNIGDMKFNEVGYFVSVYIYVYIFF